VRTRSPLPEGYSVQETASLRLFNAQGKLIKEVPGSPAAAALVEEHAWQDAWQTLDHELRNDLRAFREGVQPLEELRRLRQYMRMLDAIERAPQVAQEQEAHARVVRRRAIGGLALAAAAAAFALFVMNTPFDVADDAQPVPAPQAAQTGVPRAGTGATRAAPAVAPGAVAVVPQHVPRLAEPKAPAAAVRQGSVRVGQRPSLVSRPLSARARGIAAAARMPLTGYAVGFGEFATRATAETRMRLIRAKGYLVYVAEVGDSYLVVTRPYRTREQADRLANALQEIGLPATTQIAGMFLL
jgi:cell division protein FtsN